MLDIRCVSVCGCHSQTILLSVLARNPHKGTVREISLKTGGGREKEGLREDREEDSQQKVAAEDQSTEQVSQEMRVGQRGDQSTEVRKAATRTC